MKDARGDWCPVWLWLSFLLLHCLESAYFTDLSVVSKLLECQITACDS